ncbi:hypothetical protein GCM10011518_01950 [Flavobacterium limi]|uniref:Uncharacterized protein n=1 Tax=Flavobacterium limi TaxID=2045105 RepID=A0ABQ1TM11_9FLAO|nr:hypothetical protein GCM10011518_01950 [Flavobacterium limi]
MDVLSFICTVLPIIIHIYYKIEQSSVGKSGKTSYVDYSYVETYVFSEEEKLENMNIDSLIVCYNSTTKINDYSPKKVEQAFIGNTNLREVIVKDIIVRKNCIYIKVMYSIPYTGSNKCYGSSFSINYMKPNNCVSIYGSEKMNPEERNTFKNISNELLAALSK